MDLHFLELRAVEIGRRLVSEAFSPSSLPLASSELTPQQQISRLMADLPLLALTPRDSPLRVTLKRKSNCQKNTTNQRLKKDTTNRLRKPSAF